MYTPLRKKKDRFRIEAFTIVFSVLQQFFLQSVYICFPEEEISNMRSELEKYGIQMPAFSKIGGILANELSVDEAARKSNDLFNKLSIDVFH